MTDNRPASVAAAGGIYYLAVGHEVELFRAAWRRGLPVLLKGPTGCGKTRLVEYVAERVACRSSPFPVTRT